MEYEVQPEKQIGAPILIVDDDRAGRELVALTLSTAGHEVVQAAREWVVEQANA